MRGPRVLIVDDHAVVRHGVRQVLTEEAGPFTFGEAGNAAEAMHRILSREWNLIILDISLPGKSGFDLLKEIRFAKPKIPILVLSMHPEDQYAVRALRLGAAGYLAKDSPMSELIGALRKVASGGKYISASQAELLAGEFQRGQKPAIERLSDRELQVMLKLAAGEGIKEIAHNLSISPSTIGSHRARILRKLGLRTNADLVRFAVEHHLLK